ncbi:hypothetical protein FQZ97_1159260 [compost metagenome]
MSTQWEGLLPDMNEFIGIVIEKREPTAAEVEQLKTLKQGAGENCQTILRGLAAVGAALVHAHHEMSESELSSYGYLVQYLAQLGADLAHIEGSANSYLAMGQEVANG